MRNSRRRRRHGTAHGRVASLHPTTLNYSTLRLLLNLPIIPEQNATRWELEFTDLVSRAYKRQIPLRLPFRSSPLPVDFDSLSSAPVFLTFKGELWSSPPRRGRAGCIGGLWEIWAAPETLLDPARALTLTEKSYAVSSRRKMNILQYVTVTWKIF